MRVFRPPLVAALIALTACADAAAPLPEPLLHRSTVTNDPTTEIRVVDIRLRGTITTTTYLDAAGNAEARQATIVAGPGDVRIGVQRDTTLQLLLAEDPAIGVLLLPAVPVEVMLFGSLPLLVHKRTTDGGFTAGTPPLTMFTWPGGAPAPTRELSQVDDARFVVLAARPPAAAPGSLEGTLDFDADEWQRQWGTDGQSSLTKTGVRVRVRAQLQLVWEAKTSRMPTPSR